MTISRGIFIRANLKITLPLHIIKVAVLVTVVSPTIAHENTIDALSRQLVNVRLVGNNGKRKCCPHLEEHEKAPCLWNKVHPKFTDRITRAERKKICWP